LVPYFTEWEDHTSSIDIPYKSYSVYIPEFHPWFVVLTRLPFCHTWDIYGILIVGVWV